MKIKNKLQTLFILAAMLAACGSSSAQESASTASRSSIDCSQYDLNSSYVRDLPGQRIAKQYVIQQSGCHLTVRDTKHNEIWKIDLSGQSDVVPPDFSRSTARSSRNSVGVMQARTTLISLTRSIALLNVQGTVDLYETRDNLFHVTLGYRVELQLDTNGDLNGARNVNNISVKSAQFEVVEVKNNAYMGALGKAFVAGANYILEKVNKLNIAPALLPDLNMTRTDDQRFQN